jgi:hypothetical protein
MLLDNGTAIDAYDFSVGKCLLDGAHGFCVKVGLVVGGNQYSAINDQVISIGRRQAVSFVVDGAGKRQLQ